MEHRRLGNTDIEVPAIIFGAWAIGGGMWGVQDHDDAIAAIRTSLEAGINAIDTAALYGFGHSEELLAEAVAGYPRDQIVILTKFGLRWDHGGKGTMQFPDTKDLEGNAVSIYQYAGPESVILECERSLRRLKTDYIDVYQIHWPDKTTPVEETFGAVDKLIRDGKIRAAGVSNYTPELMERARKTIPLSSSQPPYSMVFRDAEKDVIPWCIEHNVGVLAYSPLQRGLLTGKIKPGHKFAKDDHRGENVFFQPQNIRSINAFLDEIRPIAESHNATLGQLAINWTVHRPGITAALVGARNAKQAAENARTLDFQLTAEETKRINDLLGSVKIDR